MTRVRDVIKQVEHARQRAHLLAKARSFILTHFALGRTDAGGSAPPAAVVLELAEEFLVEASALQQRAEALLACRVRAQPFRGRRR